MAGRWTASETQLRPDPRFNDKTLAKFINCVMSEGKKAVAQRCVYDAMTDIKDKLSKETNPDAPHARPARHTLADAEKPDQLKIKDAEDRQEALIDEGVEESFPASDPPSVKRIT